MARPVPIFISIVHSIFVVFILHVPVDTQGPIASCVNEIKVRKNTVYTASSESMLNISCPVTYCNQTPAVGWIKIDEGNKFIHVNQTNQVRIIQEQAGLKEMISYLIFKNISTDDNGIYRCMISTSNCSSESHNINVKVSDFHANTNSTTPPEKDASWFPYVFICLGILGLVIIVMLISFLCINLCSRNANRRRHKNAKFCPKPLSTTTPGKPQEFPEEQNNKIIYDAPTDDLPSGLDSVCTRTDQKCTAGMRNGNRRGDGSQQIVYATLQHPTPRGPSAVRHQSREQLSEYASIRIG